MKKLIISFTILFAFSTVQVTVGYANNCENQADECYSRCDKNWQGDTVFDGAGRTACKTGCAIAEAGCVIASWL